VLTGTVATTMAVVTAILKVVGGGVIMDGMLTFRADLAHRKKYPQVPTSTHKVKVPTSTHEEPTSTHKEYAPARCNTRSKLSHSPPAKPMIRPHRLPPPALKNTRMYACTHAPGNMISCKYLTAACGRRDSNRNLYWVRCDVGVT
jgi:hypothetical protein